MPIPSPIKGEKEKDYISRCMSALSDENRPQNQKLAICYSKWKSRSKHSFNFDLNIKESSLVTRNSKKSGKSEKRIIVGYVSTYDVFKNGPTMQITRQALERAKNDLLEYNTVLFNHNQDRPIGYIIETAVDDNGLLVKMVLSNTEDEIWSKVQDKTISKMSFYGEIPFDGYTIIETEEEPIIQVTEIRLLEASLVSVPGNVGAETIANYVENSIDVDSLLITEGAITYRPTTKADENEEWDGRAAQNALAKWASSDGSGDKDKINWNKYAQGFAWVDGTNKENFGSYKLPHHTISNGKLVVVWKGVAAAMSAMKGSRGGVDIPESDKSAVINHLSKHYKQFGKLVPTKESFDLEEVQEDNNVITKLEYIKEYSSNNEIKNKVDEIINQLQFPSSVISDLQILSGKLPEEDRKIIEAAVDILKSMNKKEKTNASVNEYDLTDQSETRPLFQLISDKEEIKLENGSSNKFKKQILKKGKWYHWNAKGGVLNIDDKVIDDVIRNFNEKTIENVYVPLTHTDDPSKNTGEVIALEKTENGLDAVIEIKEESIAEKIKKGLIKCISASLDPNYRNKKTNEFKGTTLLHAALVSEPYLKGMGSFIPLNDEDFANRPIIMLEDEEYNTFNILKALNEKLDNLEKKVVTEEKVKEIIIQMNKKEEDSAENEEKSAKNEEQNKKTEEMESIEQIETKKMKAKNDYKTCMGDELKKGTSMEDAAKICKSKIKESYGFELSESEAEFRLEETDNHIKQDEVDLADAEKIYEEYLRQGKIVPAQKDAFVKLFITSKKLELSDKNVDVTSTLKSFLNLMPKIVNFDENGTPGNTVSQTSPINTTAGNDSIEVPAEVKEFYEKMGLTEEQAIHSWKYAQEQKQKEESEKSTLL